MEKRQNAGPPGGLGAQAEEEKQQAAAAARPGAGGASIKDVDLTTITAEEIEAEYEPVGSRMEAEATLRKVGIHTMGKNPGEIMLLAASQGYVNIIKFYECNMYPLGFQNSFGDSLIHCAAKGSQAKTVLYLLRRGLRPTI